MKILGVIFFVVGFIIMMLGALNIEFTMYSLIGSTLAICGTLMAIFCKKTSEQIKTCQFCLEESDSKVKKCKHCGEMFSEEL